MRIVKQPAFWWGVAATVVASYAWRYLNGMMASKSNGG